VWALVIPAKCLRERINAFKASAQADLVSPGVMRPNVTAWNGTHPFRPS